MVGRIPALEDGSLGAAKKWFATVVPLVGGWHADDDVGDLGFSAAEAAEVRRTMVQIRRAAASWPDPDLVYALAAEGSFKIEKAYPGFELDVVFAASRLGFTCIAGRELPNLVMEDVGQYVLIEFPDRTGPVSKHSTFVMKKAEVPDGWNYDPRQVVVDEASAHVFHDLSEADQLVVRIAEHDDDLDDEDDYDAPTFTA